eukprot:TRINITY_DN63057_c0_g1_i1.p1 TRINITY_DN63057_c0_g1~~TRINITY_DN63057_c0_g1_i1.p1  ORF type:complete len:550 (+),score=63.88 TRINITY_DN63057_c0_g1_i1:389-2038(+)
MGSETMRVAVVGGNLLGCATAFYTRNTNPKAHIVIFERRPRLGGNKFSTVRNAVVGTAATADIASAPMLSKLLEEAAVELASKPTRTEWALFDWKEDTYKLSRSRSLWIRSALSSRFTVILMQLFALSVTIYFATSFFSGSSPFFRHHRHTGPYVHYPSILLFINAAVLAFGLIPTTLVLRFWSFMFYVLRMRVIASITYGGESLSVLSSIISQMKHHLQMIQQHDAASSCVTLGHLLSSCGMAKYAKQSAARYFSQFRLHPAILDEAMYPCLARPYADSTVTYDMNALAALLGMLAHAPLPSNLRAKPCLLSSQDAENLCPQLAKSCSADVQLNTEVVEVEKIASGWELFSEDNGERKSLGSFDAVVLAAVIDPSRFTVTGLEDNLVESLALTSKLGETESHKTQVNVMRYAAVVKGTLNAEYVRMSSEDDLPTTVTVLNSVNCAEIHRVEPGMWRVITGEEPTRTSNVIRTLFTEVESIVAYDIPKRPYTCTSLAEPNGAEAPSFILGTRFLNAACIDRIANDINLDCLSAMNAASFFNDDVATWKE